MYAANSPNSVCQPRESPSNHVRRISGGRLPTYTTPPTINSAEIGSPSTTAAPFRGVPLLLKNYLCQTTVDPYHAGLRYLRDLGWRSPQDTFLAQKFRAAGFIFLGKTNLPELARGPTTEPQAFGPTRNPWDPARSAGGSSGGSAAAVASGMVAVAHGNDGTGSLRIP